MFILIFILQQILKQTCHAYLDRSCHMYSNQGFDLYDSKTYNNELKFS